MQIQSSAMTTILPSPLLHVCALHLFKSWETVTRICPQYFVGRSSLALPVLWSSQVCGVVNEHKSGTIFSWYQVWTLQLAVSKGTLNSALNSCSSKNEQSPLRTHLLSPTDISLVGISLIRQRLVLQYSVNSFPTWQTKKKKYSQHCKK